MPVRRRLAPALALFALLLPDGADARSAVFMSAGGDADSESYGKDVSFDGTRVVFSSTGRLGGGDTDDLSDVYENGEEGLRLVSDGTTGSASSNAVISRDGTRVFFDTADPLVGADTDTRADVYMSEAGAAPELVTTGTSTTDYRVQGLDDLGSGTAVYVGDTGEYAVTRTSEAVAGVGDIDGNVNDIVAWTDHGREDFQPRLMSFNGTPGAPVLLQALSPDHRFMAFSTTERGAPATDPAESTVDVYTRDVLAAAPVHASIPGANADGTPTSDSTLRACSIAADGSSVVMLTYRRAAVDDLDLARDVYRRVLSNPGMDLLSDSPNPDGTFINASCGPATDNGATVFFNTTEVLTMEDTDLLGDSGSDGAGSDVYSSTNGGPPVLRTPGGRASGPEGGRGVPVPAVGQPNDRVSPDGTRLLFQSNENVTGADADAAADYYLQVLGGEPRLLGSGAAGSDTDTNVAFSPGGGTVRISRTDDALVAGDGDDEDSEDVFFLQEDTGTFELAAPGFEAEIYAAGRPIDGGSSVLTTGGKLAPADTDFASDVYLSFSGVVPTPVPTVPVPDPTASATATASATVEPSPAATAGPGPAATATPAPVLPAPVLSGLKATKSKVSFSANRAVSVTVKVTTRTTGRKQGSKCVKTTAKNRRKRACQRTVTVQSVTRLAAAGPNAVTIETLKPGTYKISATPAGGKSAAAVLKIKKRKRP